MDKIRQLDQHPGFHASVAMAAFPLTLWEVYTVFRLASSPKLQTFTLLLHGGLLVLVAKLLASSCRKYNFYRRARALGCGIVPVYPHKDPILGLDLVLQAVPRLKTFSAIQWISERLAKYGTHYHLTLGGEWILLTNEPENIKAILGTKFENFPIGGPRLLATLPILGNNSVFTTNGEAWHHNRAMIRPSFVRDQVADLACFDKHTSNMIRRIPTDGSTVDMQQLLQDMTMDSSSDFLLGYSTNMLTDNPAPGADDFIKAFHLANEECAKMGRINPLLFKLPNKALDANIKIEREFIRSYLRKAAADRKERLARGEPKKRSYVFLDELLDQGHAEEYLMDQLLSVMIAGRDTTAMAITTALWYLARSPSAVKKLRDEIANVGAKDPTWEQLKNMKYLNNIIKEGLRLIPPVPTNSRKANKDTVLPRGGGPDGKQPVLVPAGQAVRWSLMSMQRRTDIYGPDADEFRPERWEDDGLRPGWEYVPFSGGPRICIGQQFALTQISFVLFRVFQAFKAIEPRDDDELRLQPNLTVSFARGCPVVMTPA
ncbi:cytochrome P450 [Coniochaeta sp. PMI_546]|nr:cytochrome P450 [Coniochaeta sp. PMI_546]